MDVRRLGGCLVLVLALAACDDGGGAAPDATEQDVPGDALPDGGAIDGAGDTAVEDTGIDLGPEETADTTDAEKDLDADATSAGDAADGETTAPDGGETCEFSCENQFGQEDPSLCPTPQSDWRCVDGCCIEKFSCETDADCAEQGFEEGQCVDERFGCRCDVGSGACFTWFCGVDADCAEGEICAAGACRDAPDAGDLEVRIASRATVLSPGAAYQLAAEAWDPSDRDVVVDGELTWDSDAPDVVDVTEGGLAIGGDASGEAIISASLPGGAGFEDTIVLRNVVPEPEDTLTVVAVQETFLTPVSGHYALVDSATGETLASDALPADGVIHYTGDVAGGVDVHVFGEETDWVTWLHADGGVLYLPIPRTFWGRIVLDEDRDVVEEESTLKGANILRGEVGLGDYPKQGELELSLTSFPFATSLFDFNLTSIIGANVKQFFHPDTIDLIDSDDPADIPGGLTFAVDGPAIPEFVLAAPKGQHHVWTLGGRVALDEVTAFVDVVLDSFSGDAIDFGLLVSHLVPLFGDFWTARTETPELSGDGAFVSETISPQLRTPLGLRTALSVPPMPPMGDLGWPSSVFMIPGAVTADALFVPLGLHAGTDTTDEEKNPPDGVVDPDESTPEAEPFDVPIAPLHSGLGGPHTRYTLATVAVSLAESSGDPRPEGGSAILHRFPAGESPEGNVTLPDFLGFPMNSGWDAGSRVVTVEPMADGDIQRVLFKGREGDNWTIWLNGADTYEVPVADELVDTGVTIGDRTVDPELILVNTFELEADVTVGELRSTGKLGLDMLLHAVGRASFVDIRDLSPQN